MKNLLFLFFFFITTLAISQKDTFRIVNFDTLTYRILEKSGYHQQMKFYADQLTIQLKEKEQIFQTKIKPWLNRCDPVTIKEIEKVQKELNRMEKNIGAFAAARDSLVLDERLKTDLVNNVIAANQDFWQKKYQIDFISTLPLNYFKITEADFIKQMIVLEEEDYFLEMNQEIIQSIFFRIKTKYDAIVWTFVIDPQLQLNAKKYKIYRKN